jgi:hypothetical protein
MVIMKSGLAAFCVAAVAAAALSAPAGAQTPNRLTTCNTEWNAMKANGTVGDKKYADFRKECLARLATPGATPAPAPAPAPAPGATTAAPPPAHQPAPGTATAPPPAPGTATAPPAPGTATSPPPPPAAQPPAARPPRTATPAAPTAPARPAAPGEPVFPAAVSSKYASESAGAARRKTCLDQYNENKPTGGNAGLNWIQKGGGYYSECNKRLKG